MDATDRPRRCRECAMVLSLALLLIMACAASSEADMADPATLHLTVDNGAAGVTAGDTLTYLIAVQNQTNVAATGLVLTQSIPLNLEYVSADPGGTATSGVLTWDLDLEPNTTKTFRTVMTVLDSRTDHGPVVSVACVAAAVDAQPEVCATDTDSLSGAVGTDSAAAAEPISSTSLWWLIGVVLAVLTVIALATTHLLNRRRSGTSG